LVASPNKPAKDKRKQNQKLHLLQAPRKVKNQKKYLKETKKLKSQTKFLFCGSFINHLIDRLTLTCPGGSLILIYCPIMISFPDFLSKFSTSSPVFPSLNCIFVCPVFPFSPPVCHTN